MVRAEIEGGKGRWRCLAYDRPHGIVGQKVPMINVEAVSEWG